MRLTESFRYMDPEQKRKVIALASLGVVTLLVLLVLSLNFCHRKADIVESRPSVDETRAVSQIREAMFSVSSRLTGEDREKTVQAAVERATREKAPGMEASQVDKQALKFDPDLAHWVDPRKTPASTILVVGAAPPSYRARNVMLLGVGRGGIQEEITSENTPGWLDKAVLGPAQ